MNVCDNRAAASDLPPENALSAAPRSSLRAANGIQRTMDTAMISGRAIIFSLVFLMMTKR